MGRRSKSRALNSKTITQRVWTRGSLRLLSHRGLNVGCYEGWELCCIEHDESVTERHQSLAVAHAKRPWIWCEGCEAEHTDEWSEADKFEEPPGYATPELML